MSGGEKRRKAVERRWSSAPTPGGRLAEELEFTEGRWQEAAVTAPSWVTGRTLPISSYADISAGSWRAPHTSACPEHLSLPTLPCRRAPPANSDRNRNRRPAGSGEVVRTAPDKQGRELRLSPSGSPPPAHPRCKPRPDRDLLRMLEKSNQPFAQDGGSPWMLGALGETP